MRNNPNRSKAKGYTTRIFSVEYDLKGMIDAYGINFIHWLADEIEGGRVNCKQDVQRWSAHIALNNDAVFDPVEYKHNDNDLEDLIVAAR